MFNIEKGVFYKNGTEIAVILPPKAEIGGKVTDFITDAEPMTYKTEDGYLTAKDSVEEVESGLYKVTRTVKNPSRYERTLKLYFDLKDSFEYKKFTIPCVSFDGNVVSAGKEPHGLECDGETWIHGYDRMPIPACTVVETKDTVVSLFVSDKDENSLNTGTGLVDNKDGTLTHRIVYPYTEAPYSYTGHDEIGPRFDTYITLSPLEEFTTELYIFIGTPKWENYGTATVFEIAEKIFVNERAPELTPENVYRLGLAYCRFCAHEAKDGHWMFRNCLLPDPKDPKGYRFLWNSYEAGWSGQNISQARLFINEYIKNGENSREYLDIALSCLDGFANTQKENGLIAKGYNIYLDKTTKPVDVCNLGWAAAEFIRSYELLKDTEFARPRYLDVARGICDFLIGKFNYDTGFGLSYNEDGTAVPGSGSIGGFGIMAILELYKATGEEKYLAACEEASDFYFKRDLDNFLCTAGAIDCTCVDKETAYPFIATSLDMYEITKKDIYLERAKKAAYYFYSYAFLYDVPTPPDSDFHTYGFYTTGSTSVSAQHPVLDSWGSIVVVEMIRLYKITKEDIWLLRVRLLWESAILCITTEDNMKEVHGRIRPLGAQNEAYFQTRWARPSYYFNVEKRGSLNHLFADWCGSYRMQTLDKMEKLYGKESWDLLR